MVNSGSGLGGDRVRSESSGPVPLRPPWERDASRALTFQGGLPPPDERRGGEPGSRERFCLFSVRVEEGFGHEEREDPVGVTTEVGVRCWVYWTPTSTLPTTFGSSVTGVPETNGLSGLYTF